MSSDTLPTPNLFEVPGNSIPDEAVHGLLPVQGEVFIRYARWESSSAPSRGTIILLHGRTECVEKYFETVDDFRKLGFGVVTFDWRGQGGSTRVLGDPLKGHVEHFSQYLDDLEAVVSQIMLPDCKPPYFLLGHSTGGLAALFAAPALSNRFSRMVLIAPLLELEGLPVRQRLLKQILGFLTYIGFGRNYVPDTSDNIDKISFEDNKLTSDWTRFSRRGGIFRHQRQLALSGPTVAWLYSALRASEDVTRSSFVEAISIPTLFILGSADRVVSSPFSERFARKMRTGSFLTIPGARHEILQEADIYREQALAAIDMFLPKKP